MSSFICIDIIDLALANSALPHLNATQDDAAPGADSNQPSPSLDDQPTPTCFISPRSMKQHLLLSIDQFCDKGISFLQSVKTFCRESASAHDGINAAPLDEIVVDATVCCLESAVKSATTAETAKHEEKIGQKGTAVPLMINLPIVAQCNLDCNSAQGGDSDDACQGPQKPIESVDQAVTVMCGLSLDSGIEVTPEKELDYDEQSAPLVGSSDPAEEMDADDFGVAWLHDQAEFFELPSPHATSFDQVNQEAEIEEEEEYDDDDEDDEDCDEWDDYVPIPWAERQRQREAMAAGQIQCRSGWEFDTTKLADVRETHAAILEDPREHLGRPY